MIIPPSFEVIAAAVAIAAAKLKYDLDQVELLAARINLSPMGEALATTQIRKNLEALAYAHQFFKGNEGLPDRVERAEAALREILKLADGAYASSWLTMPGAWGRINDIRVKARSVVGE